jgi:hypothetical protein
MVNLLKRGRSRVLLLAATAGLAVLSLPGTVIADPPVLPAIPEIIDYDSIATVIAAAGAVILLLVFGYTVGFGLVWKLMKRIRKVI